MSLGVANGQTQLALSHSSTAAQMAQQAAKILKGFRGELSHCAKSF
jgi:hypothetical protein